jgi:formate hydrogenlyase subunit 3/multisubunit Na+/H+ antiporter MnhD subunit
MTHDKWDAIRNNLIIATPIVCAMAGTWAATWAGPWAGPAGMPWYAAALGSTLAALTAMIAVSASCSCVRYARSDAAL